jgi:hypothetical protein
MKSVKLGLALVAVCLLVLPLAWSQGGNAEEQLKKLTDQMLAVQLKGDTDSYATLLADDYTVIRGDGTLSTKAQDVENFKSGVVKYEAADVRDSKVRVYGNTGIVILLVAFKGTISGKPFSGDTRSTRIWVKQKGSWKCVAYQATRVVPPSK